MSPKLYRDLLFPPDEVPGAQTIAWPKDGDTTITVEWAKDLLYFNHKGYEARFDPEKHGYLLRVLVTKKQDYRTWVEIQEIVPTISEVVAVGYVEYPVQSAYLELVVHAHLDLPFGETLKHKIVIRYLLSDIAQLGEPS